MLTDEKRFRGFEVEPRVICSLPQFVRSFARVNSHRWDCLIADEAHLLANPASRRRQCAGELRSTWRLLLSATPIANRLTDLYSLIDLAVPGSLGTQREFEDEFVADPGTCRVVRPDRAAALRTSPAIICVAPAGVILILPSRENSRYAQYSGHACRRCPDLRHHRLFTRTLSPGAYWFKQDESRRGHS